MGILITGDAGVIGTELKKIVQGELLLVDKKNGCDLSKDDLSFIVDFNPETVFHLAASFERLYEDREFFKVNQSDNILASTRLNRVLRHCDKLKRYVFASSYLVYDEELYTSKYQPLGRVRLNEKCRINARNLIGASKYYTEKEIEFIAKDKFSFVHARIFRGYGCGSRDVISRTVRQKLDQIPTATYHLENSYDFIHAKDTAEALFRLSQIDYSGVVNVGTSVPCTMEEVFKTIGNKTFPINAPGLLAQPYENSVCDNSKLKSLTGWVPKINVREGIKIVEEYERSQK